MKTFKQYINSEEYKSKQISQEDLDEIVATSLSKPSELAGLPPQILKNRIRSDILTAKKRFAKLELEKKREKEFSKQLKKHGNVPVEYYIFYNTGDYKKYAYPDIGVRSYNDAFEIKNKFLDNLEKLEKLLSSRNPSESKITKLAQAIRTVNANVNYSNMDSKNLKIIWRKAKKYEKLEKIISEMGISTSLQGPAKDSDTGFILSRSRFK